MTPKTTLQTQRGIDWLPDWFKRSGAQWFKAINWYPNFPGVKVIGRIHMPESKQDALVARGDAGGTEWFFECLPTFLANSHIYIWEGPNEVSIWNKLVLAGYVAFNQRIIELAHKYNLRIMVGQINTGWPHKPADDGGKQVIAIGEGAKGADGIGLHGYGQPGLWSDWEWNALRCVKIHEWLCRYGYMDHAPFFLTEYGIDQPHPNGPNYGHYGWKHFITDENHWLEQLVWYEKEIQKLDYVECATYFVVGSEDWSEFDLSKDLAFRLADAIKGGQSIPVPPPNPGGGMNITVQYKESGVGLVVGNYGIPYKTITLTDPWGNKANTVTGSKPEFGEDGGFEFRAPYAGTPYSVTVEGKSAVFEHKGKMTVLIFDEIVEPVVPPIVPPVEPPTPTPLPNDDIKNALLRIRDDIDWALEVLGV